MDDSEQYSLYERLTMASNGGLHSLYAARKLIDEAMGALTQQRQEIDRLQRVIDGRPAINAGLPETYIDWSRSIYAMQMIRATEAQQ